MVAQSGNGGGKTVIRHTHTPYDENCVWHDGSLVDCPESTWVSIMLDDGREGRFYNGYSVSPPPPTSKRLRLIDNVA
jgi:hypothetical protein